MQGKKYKKDKPNIRANYTNKIKTFTIINTLYFKKHTQKFNVRKLIFFLTKKLHELLNLYSNFKHSEKKTKLPNLNIIININY